MEGGALCGIELAPRGEVEAAMAEWICDESGSVVKQRHRTRGAHAESRGRGGGEGSGGRRSGKVGGREVACVRRDRNPG